MIPRTLIAAALFAQVVAPKCGSGSNSSTTMNFQSIVVNAGPANDYLNGVFTTVTVCAAGQSTCQTIDGVLVDTGSTGVRILASRLAGLSLSPQTDGSGGTIAECEQFSDGFTWGAVVAADVRLGGEQASGIPIQSIGGSGFAVPTDCANSGAEEDTLATLGANGILGVGPFGEDCGPACTFTGASNPGLYYTCRSSGCTVTAQALARQVQNPVRMFPADNNGVSIQFPSVPTSGAPTVSGLLTFGIGTQSNNGLGSAKVLPLDASGNFTTIFGGQSYGDSYIDSGSNGIFFLTSSITGMPMCRVNSDFYCPPSPQTFTATNQGVNGATSTATFTVSSVDALSNAVNASSGVAGPNPGSFDWGLSFFYGRTVFTAIERQSTPGGTGPYFAY